MRGLFGSLFGFFLSWWGVILLAALDSSLFFFVPLGNDALVVYMVARHPKQFWLYPLLTTFGSVIGGATTYWIGRKAGEAGLPRFIPGRKLANLKTRVGGAGALAIGVAAALPPPFPLTPFLLTCGALEMSATRLAIAFTGARILRFGIEALLARRYGTRVLAVLESDPFQYVIVGFTIIAIVGTVISAITLWRRTGTPARAR